MNRNDFLAVHRQLLDEDIINGLAELKNINIREALDIFYRSRLARDVEEGLYGLDCLSPNYLAEDLIENEPELFNKNTSGHNPT